MNIIRTTKQLRTPVFEVHESVARDSRGREMKRSIVSHAGSAVAMPMDPDGRVLLVSQYRMPIDEKLWELPAGRIDPGETPLAAAKRELAEETGIHARKWKKLVVLYPSPGFLAEKMHIYLATDLRFGRQSLQEEEDLEMRWFTRDDLEAKIAKGRLRDAKTLTSLLLTWRNS